LEATDATLTETHLPHAGYRDGDMPPPDPNEQEEEWHLAHAGHLLPSVAVAGRRPHPEAFGPAHIQPYGLIAPLIPAKARITAI
jgi:hypothetical protein